MGRKVFGNISTKQIADELAKKGYKVSNVGDVLLKTDYIVDNNGMQKAKI